MTTPVDSRQEALERFADDFMNSGGRMSWALPFGCLGITATASGPLDERPVINFEAAWYGGTALSCTREIPEGGLIGNIAARLGR